MMGINFKDIVALATAGYKVSEVKELIALSNQSEAEPHKEEGDKIQAEKAQQHEGGKEQPHEAVQNATEEPETDSVILSYKKKVEELEKQVKNLQEKNVHTDLSDKEKKDDQQLLNELAASYM